MSDYEFNRTEIGRVFNNSADIFECECKETTLCAIHIIYDDNHTNHDIIADWVQRLRSGDYLQGKENLRTEDDCYCCLGVLADVVDPEGWAEDTDGDKYFMCIIGDSGGAFLERSEALKLGIDYETQKILGGLNDMGISFDEIADCIEANSFASLVKDIPEFAQKGSE